MKRTVLIVGGVILLIAIGVAIYFLFFTSKGPGIAVDDGTNFGTGGDFAGTGGEAQPVGETGEKGDEVAPNLIRITEGPVAYGTLAFSAENTIEVEFEGSTTAKVSTKKIFTPEVRYVEKQSGNVYSYDLNSRTLTRISNRTLPGIQEVAWTLDGTTAFLRFLSTNDNGGESIDTYALPTEKEDGGYFLETGLDQVLVSGTSSVITLLPSTAGSIATIARVDGANARTLFSSNLSSLRLLPAGKSIAAFTKPSAQMDGFGFLISPTGVFDRVLGPLRGLTLLPSPSGKSILYSYLSGTNIVAGVMDVATRTTIALPVGALPEKCVWASNEAAVYCAIPRTQSAGWPDSWYQGVTTFSDRFWKIDLTSRTAALVVDPVTIADVAIDGVSLAIDPQSDALVFTNKKNGSLWAFDL
jgi:hypothetical protein